MDDTQKLAAGRLSEGLHELMMESEQAAFVLDAGEPSCGTAA
jgi:hypothetical protein